MIEYEKFNKVIKGILGAINDEIDEPSYPYFEESRIDTGLTREISVALLKDALALLKAQEPSDDWISRNRLKNEIQYYIDEAGWGEEINKALGWCLEFIDNQEAVKWK